MEVCEEAREDVSSPVKRLFQFSTGEIMVDWDEEMGQSEQIREL